MRISLRPTDDAFYGLFSRAAANLVRVRADTDDAPFDVNEGMKLELGSTAKLRTLAHYLEVMAELHDELSPLGTAALESRAAQAREPVVAVPARHVPQDRAGEQRQKREEGEARLPPAHHH